MERRAFCQACGLVLWLTLLTGGLPTGVAAPEEDWVAVAIKREAVNSTNLRSIGYHRGLRVLEIEFHSGRVYRYRNVPMDVYGAFIRADSKGRHFSRQIRDRYEFKRIGGGKP